MILITELTEPYTEEEKFNFLVTHKDKIIRFEDDSIKVYKLTEEEKQAEMLEQFNKEFFNTSLGYIRRKVTMATGETKDFLSDLLPTISMGVQMGQPVKIITYNKPDFTQEITDWTVLQNEKTVTAEFVQECMLQLSRDFGAI